MGLTEEEVCVGFSFLILTPYTSQNLLIFKVFVTKMQQKN
ncbi:hypothetical protein APA_4469 [Pseudanabaena sp. lw0831]|nr:hypothetical protein APA_4469 [Pseudanabaena sp. lw0831]